MKTKGNMYILTETVAATPLMSSIHEQDDLIQEASRTAHDRMAAALVVP